MRQDCHGFLCLHGIPLYICLLSAYEHPIFQTDGCEFQRKSCFEPWMGEQKGLSTVRSMRGCLSSVHLGLYIALIVGSGDPSKLINVVTQVLRVLQPGKWQVHVEDRPVPFGPC